MLQSRTHPDSLDHEVGVPEAIKVGTLVNEVDCSHVVRNLKMNSNNNDPSIQSEMTQNTALISKMGIAFHRVQSAGEKQMMFKTIFFLSFFFYRI